MREHMDHDHLAVLHEHYQDTCSTLATFRHRRDLYFYMLLVLSAVFLFDVYSPATLSAILAEALKSRLGVHDAPDLGFVRSVLWFLLLGVTIRYCQTAIHIERQYPYLHGIERLVAAEFPEPAFTREGHSSRLIHPGDKKAHKIVPKC